MTPLNEIRPIIEGYNEETGLKAIFDVPNSIESADHFQSLISGINKNPRQREELQGWPILKGYKGPMFNGFRGPYVVIRYEA